MIYAGIDEAGYGPILGPLSVACSVFEIPEQAQGGATPDLWDLLGTVVCRARSETTTSRIAIADSKQLKLANSVKRQHPLHHLELGVLGFLGASSTDTEQSWSVERLCERLHAEPGTLPWYNGDADPALPLGTTMDHLRLLTTRLRSACESAAVRPVEMRCLLSCEERFNTDFKRLGSKAALSFERVGALIGRVWRSEAARHDDPAGCPRIVVDRQGGRTRYAAALQRVLPGTTVETLGESEARSVYEISERGRRIRVSFEVEAESRHLPVALASMTAKLMRELMIARLNAYWLARLPELKPTAGYAADGSRYLKDLAAVASQDELRRLRRHA